MKTHELIELEILKDPIGIIDNKTIFNRHYLLHIREKTISLSQYELDQIFKSIKLYYGKSEQIAED